MIPRPPLDIAVGVEAGDWPADAAALAERAVFAALAQSRAEVVGACELSILLTDDAHQRVLNREWRGIDKPTNVLSFPQLPPFAPLVGLLGDLSLAHETLAREAVAMDIGFADHFTHLVVHGFLHLLGYDHIEEEAALQMESLETQILTHLGIADPYADG